MKSPPRSLVHRLRVPIAAAALGAVALATAVTALADCGDVQAATLSGEWHLRITVAPSTVTAGYTFRSSVPVGTTALETVLLSSTCSAAGVCTAAMTSPSPGASFQLVDNTVDWYWDTSTVMVHAGSSFSGTTVSGGYGGPDLPSCHPPPNLGRDTLTLTVLEATEGSAGDWHAIVVAGTESLPDGWACDGSVGVNTGAENLTLLAVPVGASFPASTNLACAAPAVTAAPGNPDVSSFSSGLATPAQAFGSPLHTLIGAAITLGVILFITFPAQLFNRTFEDNYDDIRDMTLRRLRWLRRFRREAEREAGGLLRFGAFAAVVLVGALLGSLNDPDFGLNLRSAATYLAVVLAILAGVLVGGMVGAVYRRLRHQHVEPRLHALPAGLAVAAACVLVSRLSSFAPGYLYGVIAGLAFQGTLAKREQGHTVALGAIAGLLVAVAAWLIWIPVGQSARVPGAPFGIVLLADLLAAVFVGGLVGQVISLMPLAFLPGGTLLQWSRAAWAATFAVAVFGLIEVELRPQSTAAHPGGAPVVTAVLLFVLFGGGTAALRLYFSRREKRRREEEGRGVPPEARPEAAPATPPAAPTA